MSKSANKQNDYTSDILQSLLQQKNQYVEVGVNKDVVKNVTDNEVSDMTDESERKRLLIAKSVMYTSNVRMKDLDQDTCKHVKKAVHEVIWKEWKFPTSEQAFTGMLVEDETDSEDLKRKKKEAYMSVIKKCDKNHLSDDDQLLFWTRLCAPMVEEIRRARNEKNNSYKKKVEAGT